MRWYDAEVIGLEQTGTDVLGNPVCEEKCLGHIAVRKTPWGTEDGGSAGNPFDMLRRTFLSRAPAASLEGAVAVRVERQRYELERVSQSDRGAIITGTLSKPKAG